MNRLTVLHRNPNHKKAENTKFILRFSHKLKDASPHKIDCINLFIQYYSIYQALEDRLAELNFKSLDISMLEIFNNEVWQNRSQDIKADINEMMTYLTKAEKKGIMINRLPATNEMIDSISEANPTQLFAFLSVRCLGDVFGGQRLNEYTQKTFGTNELSGQFYNKVSEQINSLCRFVNKAELLNEQEFEQAGNLMFEHHISLFEQLEAVRPELGIAYNPPKSQCWRKLAITGVSFFAAATVTAAAWYSKDEIFNFRP